MIFLINFEFNFKCSEHHTGVQTQSMLCKRSVTLVDFLYCIFACGVAPGCEGEVGFRYICLAGEGGYNGDGNIMKAANLQAFQQYVLEQTGQEGVHFVMADGVRGCGPCFSSFLTSASVARRASAVG